MLKEGLQGTAAPNGPGTPNWGDGESNLVGGWCSRGACAGQQLPTARAYPHGGTGSPPRRWSVLKDGLREAAVPYGTGTPAPGDGESCPGGGRYSRRACGGQ